MLALLGQHFRDAERVDDCSQPRVDAYVAARRSGAIASPRHRTPEPGARSGTIRNELALLRTIVRWGRETKVDGRPLVTGDPLLGVVLPQEANARRPVTTEARYQATLAHADAADARGRFRCLLVLARHTAQRINALCQLRASDVLRTRTQLEAALARAGQPVGHAAQWPHGGVHFRAEHDKRGYAAVVPINAEARAALDAYLRDHPRVGEAPLFPATGDDAAPVHKVMAGYWLKRAEMLAGLPPLERAGWHAYRRQWASERRHLPPQDLMAAGGWRSVQTLQRAYQHADAATTYAVVALTPSALPSGAPPARAAGSADG
jgi:integrase